MKKTKIISIFLLFLLSITLSACTNSTEGKTYYFDKDGNMSTTKPEPEVADNIQVFMFHATQRCATCTAVGKLAGETVNERFQDELKSGRIEFKEVNIDLPENKELARKFKASGSTLRINAIKNGEDNITEDTRVWSLAGNPEAFKDYLENKINTLLGK